MTVPAQSRTTVTPHTRLRNPMPDATDEGLRVENALLYRRLILLETSLIKHAAALELATGVPWDEKALDSLDADGLKQVVAQNLSHGLGISIMEAHKRVRLHGRLVASTQIETPDSNESEA